MSITTLAMNGSSILWNWFSLILKDMYQNAIGIKAICYL